MRTLGASAYKGAEVLASDTTRGLIAERGKEDMDSKIGRFPRLFRGVETIPGLTWPTLTFPDQISLWLGRREVCILHIGCGHTAGEVIAVVPDAGTVFSGDLVEQIRLLLRRRAFRRLAGDARQSRRNEGRGAGARARRRAHAAGDGGGGHRACRRLHRDALRLSGRKRRQGPPPKDAIDFVRFAMDPKFKTFALYEHCLPFNVARAYDEARGIEWPVIWTAARAREMWAALQG